MADCVFCKIANGEIPTSFIKETQNFMVFDDIRPSAPIHILIVPKKHVVGVENLPDELWVEAKNIAVGLAKERGMKGYRISNNNGEAAEISHLHIHLLSGISKSRKV